MKPITIVRYQKPTEYLGYISPAGEEWMLFVRADGGAELYQPRQTPIGDDEIVSELVDGDGDVLVTLDRVGATT